MKTFPTSAVWCFGILFISVSLITTGSSEVQVVGPADRVVALAGDDIILPCSLKPNVSAEDKLVEWTRLFSKAEILHLYRDSRDSYVDQSPSYRGRTSMFHEELKNGNVSLKLTRVTLSDAGRYRCFLPTLTSQVKETTVQLFVGAVSQPVISIVGTKDWGVVLKCESGGWFPEPEMECLDSSGTILPADGPPERHRDSEGLYAVKQHVTVDQTDTNRFTCRVNQTEINHLKETEIHVPDDLFPKPPTLPICMGNYNVFYFVGVGVVVLAALAYVLSRKCTEVKKLRKQLEEQDGLQGELNELNKNLTGQLEELRIENDGLKEELNGLKEELRKAKETISTSPGGQQETQTPSQKSERIEGMEMKSFPGRKSAPGSGRKSAPDSGRKSAPAPEMESLLAAGSQKDDLDEMERGGRVATEFNSML